MSDEEDRVGSGEEDVAAQEDLAQSCENFFFCNNSFYCFKMAKQETKILLIQ